MTTHSSVLSWKIPWTEESGRLQSMGSQSQAQLRNLVQAQDQNYVHNIFVCLCLVFVSG